MIVTTLSSLALAAALHGADPRARSVAPQFVQVQATAPEPKKQAAKKKPAKKKKAKTSRK